MVTVREREILARILRSYGEAIELVGIFGSRALGTARPASDIDLVIYGKLTESQVQRLWTEFDESALAVTVDVANYADISHAGLKRHIDKAMRPLFRKADLLQAA